MNFKKLKSFLEIIILIGIFIGVFLLYKEYSSLNQMMIQLSQGDFSPTLEYISNKTGKTCICFNNLN